MARKKKDGAGGEDPNFWMGTFSDLLNLLLTFFVLLFSMKSMDKGKLDEALGYFRGGGIGPLELGERRSVITPPKVLNELAPVTGDLSPEQIRKLLQQREIKKNVDISEDDRGVVVTLSSGLLFDSGEARVQPEARDVLNEVANLVANTSRQVSIEGHTDDLPLVGGRYRSNWELSLARAVDVLNYLLEDPTLNPARFSVAGYADTRPLAPNDSEENRSKNRRVEIILLGEAAPVDSPDRLGYGLEEGEFP